MSALSIRLAGRTVAACFSNGHVLSIRCADGSEVNLAWADDEGRPLMGKPMVVSSGGRLQAHGVQDLARHPSAPALSAALGTPRRLPR